MRQSSRTRGARDQLAFDSAAPDRLRTAITPLLRVVHQRIIDDLHEYLHSVGFPEIRATHGKNILAHIDAQGSRITELAIRAQMTKQSIAEMVDYLEQHGYVERVADGADGRAKMVRLTEKGWAAEREAREGLLRIEEELASQLGNEDFGQMKRLLQRLTELLAAGNCKAQESDI